MLVNFYAKKRIFYFFENLKGKKQILKMAFGLGYYYMIGREENYLKIFCCFSKLFLSFMLLLVIIKEEKMKNPIVWIVSFWEKVDHKWSETFLDHVSFSGFVVRLIMSIDRESLLNKHTRKSHILFLFFEKRQFCDKFKGNLIK